MRFSSQSQVKPTELDARSNADFFRQISSQLSAEQCRAGIVLVGARDVRSIAVRQAQASLRYDRRSSYFSHAALIARWNAQTPDESVGFEASLDPIVPAQSVPERNGVTAFKLGRYADPQLYPNVAFIAIDLKPDTQLDIDGKSEVQLPPEARKDEIIEAARNPCRERETYPLWEGLGVWSNYQYSPERLANPLLDHVPLPAAAYVEYAYGAHQIDITPGAVGRQTCPELLWATFQRWQEGLLASAAASIAVYACIRDEAGVAAPPLPMLLPLDPREI